MLKKIVVAVGSATRERKEFIKGENLSVYINGNTDFLYTLLTVKNNEEVIAEFQSWAYWLKVE